MNFENQNRFKDIENQNKQLLKNSSKNNTIQINRIINSKSNQNTMTSKNFNNLSNNDLNDILIEINNQQNEQFNSFNNEFEKFKYEVFRQLQNLSQSKIKNPNMQFNLPQMSDNYKELKNMDNNNSLYQNKLLPLNHKNKDNNNYEENTTTILRNVKYSTINKKNVTLNNNETRKIISKNDENLINNMLKDNSNIDEKNKVIERGTNIYKNSLYKPIFQDDDEDENIINTNLKVVNDSNNNYNNNFDNNQQRLKSVGPKKKSKIKTELENIYKYWERRENNIIFNPDLKTVLEKEKNYKILDIDYNNENQLNFLLNQKEKEYNIDLNNTNQPINNYCDVLNQIFSNYLKKTDKKGKLYGKYKDNALSMACIEDFIENIPEFKNDIYGNNNVDKIYDYLNYVKNDFN
jgi:hypothetical protein